MTKTVLTFGLISGLLLAGMFLLTIPLVDDIGFERGAIIGYASMLAASLLIYFGIRSYRDNVGDGAVGFGRAIAVGILIVVVSSVLYVATWEIIQPRYMPDFYKKYEASMIETARAKAVTPADFEQRQAKIKSDMAMYQKPIVNVLFTFIEPLPVGLIVTLISAWVLSRRRRLQPA